MSKRVIGRGALLAALTSATLLVAGCETATTYHPATGYGFNREGFSEQQIEPNRWLVSFAGNTVTPRDTVERYLLFRAAELTLQQGANSFVMVDRQTDRQSRTYATPGYGSGWGYGGFGGYWSPGWRFHRGIGAWGGAGWGGWGGRGWGDPFYDGFDVQTVDRVEAEAQIVTYRGPVPRDNPRAFDAHAVVQTLGPTIMYPGQNGGGYAPPPPPPMRTY